MDFPVYLLLYDGFDVFTSTAAASKRGLSATEAWIHYFRRTFRPNLSMNTRKHFKSVLQQYRGGVAAAMGKLVEENTHKRNVAAAMGELVKWSKAKRGRKGKEGQ